MSRSCVQSLSKEKAEREKREGERKGEREKTEIERKGEDKNMTGQDKIYIEEEVRGGSCPYYPSSYSKQHIPLRNREGIHCRLYV